MGSISTALDEFHFSGLHEPWHVCQSVGVVAILTSLDYKKTS